MWAGYYGDSELAIAALRIADTAWPLWLPLLADARRTPEFKVLVTEMGLVDYWREFGWGGFCQPVGANDFECQ